MESDHETMEKMAKLSSPELKASVFSILTWHWLQPFVSFGNTKTLEAGDLYALNPKEGTHHCGQLWNDAVEKMKCTSSLNATPSVWKLMWICFGMEYARAALFRPLWLVSVIIQVYILRALVEAVQNVDDFTWWWGVLLVMGMFWMSALASISINMCLSLSQKVGMKIRSTISMAVFNKLLSMKLVSMVDTNSGLMLNLLTNDSQKLLDAATVFNFASFALIDIGTISALVIMEIGVSAIPGVVVAFLTQPIQAWMTHVGARLRSKAVKCTDSRVHLIGEVLSGARFIKYNGCIAPFLHRIADLRRDEMYKIKKASFLRASTFTIRESVTPLASLASFGMYLAIHKGTFMPPSKAFTVFALFGVLVQAFSICPQGLQLFGEAIVAMRRLQNLLNLDEINDIGEKDNEVSKDLPDKAVVLTNCSFCWKQRVKKVISSDMDKGSEKICIKFEKKGVETVILGTELNKFNDLLVLKNINISVGKGEFVSIYGPVGSGKSSLLFGILGEMQCLKGRFYVQRNIAYAPQQPWILNDTIRRNIVFTSPFDPERYRRTIAACALEHDISQFAAGHDTEIGDRGINLSGGQKARISLARACYTSAPVVFLDDPLSAVDALTAKHLIEHVLNGILRGRAVILVTHNKAALDVCDCVYFMENGMLQEPEGHRRRSSPGTSTISSHTNTDTNSPPEFTDQEINSIMYVNEIGNGKADNDNFVKSDSLEKLQPAPYDLGGDVGKGKTTVKEDRVEGNIKTSTWIAYGKAAGGLPIVAFVILVFTFGHAVLVMVNYWLQIWTDRKYHLKQDIYLAVYASFALGATILSLARALIFTQATIVAATKMHGQMAERVLRSPQLFFDQNVVGRILNRFSKDQALVDEILPNTAQCLFDSAFSSLGGIIFIGVLIPWFLLVLPPIFVSFVYVQRRYLVISRELKRLEATSRSPIYAHFTQTLQGIASVRAYGAQTKVREIFLSLIDANHRSYILFAHMSRWVGMRLDFATSMCVALACTLVILLRQSISPGLAGVLLVQSIQVTVFIHSTVRLAAEAENYITSVERIDVYANLPSEANPTTAPGIIETDWPSRGEIEFVKYTMTYRVDLPPVLNEVSVKIKAREKIGILGRTGVGKSSLAAALFRMVENKECKGDILIDDVNIKLVGLDDLRQRLSIIPQDPFLFQGSLRFNLDPFEAYSDIQIYNALSRVHLTEKIKSLDGGLNSLIAQNGENFSVGQRQLICLARSLLRRSRIIVMDEATAAVDGETGSLIQTTLRTTFQDCTMLTIAHRIDTVIDCDRVLILTTGGNIAEFDSPHKLLSCHDQGIFAEMVRKTGPTISQRLREAARDAERQRKEQEHHIPDFSKCCKF